MSAPFYTNQIDIISQVAKAIPVDHTLYVKEHYSMRIEAWRHLEFYKKLQELPNVLLVHPNFDSKSLLQNCSLVVTITGTSALEGGFYKKPAIVFSHSSFSYLPFITVTTNFNDLPKIIRTQINSDHDYTTINHYIDLLNHHSLQVNPMNLIYDIATQLHDYNGLTKEVEISENRMKDFLNAHKDDFEKIADEYLKLLN